MRKSNQKKQPINNFSTDTASADLFQSISDKQAETIKGGHGYMWERYCKKAKQVKPTPILY